MIKLSKAGSILNFQILYNYKDLIVTISSQQLKAKYGNLFWGVIRILGIPALTTFVYAFFLKMAFNVQSSGFEYFTSIYSGMLPWLFFRNLFLSTAESAIKERVLLKKANFPRLIIPLSSWWLNFIELLPGVLLLVLFSITSVNAVNTMLFFFSCYFVSGFLLCIRAWVKHVLFVYQIQLYSRRNKIYFAIDNVCIACFVFFRCSAF